MPPSTGTQVADRLYYTDSALTAFTAKVSAIREVAKVDGRQLWQIALDRTAFYPAGGGQPFDIGTLTATARSGASLEAPITSVEEDGNGEVWHTTQKPLQEGTFVHGHIDAARRRDHTQQHSGQHLLSAVLDRDFQARTVSFHLGPQHCTIDAVSEPLHDETMLRVERAVNEMVADALPVSIRFVSQEEAEAMLAAGLLRKLPLRAGQIRLVEIPGLDLNACGGTHVSNTAQIGPVLLRGTERLRDAVRISFTCGDRALAAARADFQQLASLAQSLSTGAENVAGNVARLQLESRAAEKERGLLLRALAGAEAVSVHSTGLGTGGEVLTHIVDASKPGHNAAYAKLLAACLVEDTPTRVALVAVPEHDRCSVVLAAKPGEMDCGSTLRSALADLGGRGGGSNDMAQGSLPVQQLPMLLKTFAGQGKAVADQER